MTDTESTYWQALLYEQRLQKRALTTFSMAEDDNEKDTEREFMEEMDYDQAKSRQVLQEKS